MRGITLFLFSSSLLAQSFSNFSVLDTKESVLSDTGERYVIKLIAGLPEGEGYKLFKESNSSVAVGLSSRLEDGLNKNLPSTIVNIYSNGYKDLLYYYKPATNELFEAGKICRADRLDFRRRPAGDAGDGPMNRRRRGGARIPSCAIP